MSARVRFGTEAGSFETASEVALLPASQSPASLTSNPCGPKMLQTTPDGLCTTHRHDRDTLRLEIPTLTLGQRRERRLVAEPLDEHDRPDHARTIERRRRSAAVNVERRQRSEPATSSRRSIASCMPASMPESMIASRTSLLGHSTRIVRVVRPSASTNETVFSAPSLSGTPS